MKVPRPPQRCDRSRNPSTTEGAVLRRWTAFGFLVAGAARAGCRHCSSRARGRPSTVPRRGARRLRVNSCPPQRRALLSGRASRPRRMLRNRRPTTSDRGASPHGNRRLAACRTRDTAENPLTELSFHLRQRSARFYRPLHVERCAREPGTAMSSRAGTHALELARRLVCHRARDVAHRFRGLLRGLSGALFAGSAAMPAGFSLARVTACSAFSLARVDRMPRLFGNAHHTLFGPPG